MGTIFEIDNPCIHPCAVAIETVGCKIGIFKGLPGQFQQDTLLWINGCCLSGRNTKKLWVKCIYIMKKSTISGVHFTRSIRICIKPGIHIPTFSRDFFNGIISGTQFFPKDLRGAALSREAARHADHRNWLTVFLFQCIQFFLHLLQSKQGTFSG